MEESQGVGIKMQHFVFVEIRFLSHQDVLKSYFGPSMDTRWAGELWGVREQPYRPTMLTCELCHRKVKISKIFGTQMSIVAEKETINPAYNRSCIRNFASFFRYVH